MKYSAFIACLSAIALAPAAALAKPVAGKPAKTEMTTAEMPLPQSNDERWMQQIIVLTNRERQKHGLTPLKYHAQLSRSARWLAHDMGDNDYLDHQDKQGRNIDPRIPAFGYADYERLGENVAGGQSSPETVFESWMNSEHHRANILNPDFREIGVGYMLSMSGRYRRYWVQDFGARFDGFPVVINDEAAQTDTPDVKLYVYGENWARSMRVSNDGKTWSKWQPYRSAVAWTLEAGSGKRTVFVEIRGGETGNEVRQAQDTVTLTSALSGERIARK